MAILNNIVDKIRDLKNYSLSKLAIIYANNKIEEYGEMVNLRIDSKNKNIELEILLKGEKESISVNIDRYEVIQKDNSTYIKFKNISASREWITVLINNVLIPEYAPKKMYEIDSTYAKVVDLLI